MNSKQHLKDRNLSTKCKYVINFRIISSTDVQFFPRELVNRRHNTKLNLINFSLPCLLRLSLQPLGSSMSTRSHAERPPPASPPFGPASSSGAPRGLPRRAECARGPAARGRIRRGHSRRRATARGREPGSASGADTKEAHPIELSTRREEEETRGERSRGTIRPVLRRR